MKYNKKQVINEIRGDKVYVEPIERIISDKSRYDFVICRVRDSLPLLSAGAAIYDSSEEAIFAGKILAKNIQIGGILEEKLAA